jgi:hypothetical protein
VALATLAACASLAACGATGTTSGDTSGVSPEAVNDGSIEVPDVSSDDGVQAVSDIEDAGLEATLADANNDPGFDSSRDANGCEVTDQSPAAGESASEGDEVTITVDCSQVDWENQEGPQWDAFDEAYQSSFDDGCDALFDESPSGSLYEDGVEYSALDCQNENPGDAADASDVPTDVPDDPEAAGTELGELDGCQALFENQGVVSLNYGSDSITEADCPIGGSAPATPQPTKPKTSPSKHADSVTAGDRCTSTLTNGTRVVLTVTDGEIRCAGAIALFSEWLRRAPKEGTGSGGDLKLYGWECSGAPATQAPRIGSCQRSGADAAAFSVRAATRYARSRRPRSSGLGRLRNHGAAPRRRAPERAAARDGQVGVRPSCTGCPGRDRYLTGRPGLFRRRRPLRVCGDERVSSAELRPDRRAVAGTLPRRCSAGSASSPMRGTPGSPAPNVLAEMIAKPSVGDLEPPRRWEP